MYKVVRISLYEYLCNRFPQMSLYINPSRILQSSLVLISHSEKLWVPVNQLSGRMVRLLSSPPVYCTLSLYLFSYGFEMNCWHFSYYLVSCNLQIDSYLCEISYVNIPRWYSEETASHVSPRNVTSWYCYGRYVCFIRCLPYRITLLICFAPSSTFNSFIFFDHYFLYDKTSLWKIAGLISNMYYNF